MKRFMIFMVLLFAMVVDVQAEVNTGFDMVGYEANGFVGAVAPIDTGGMQESVVGNEKTDKYQMSYAQVNCDRCHIDDVKPDSIMNSVNYYNAGDQLTAMRSLDHRLQF